jgi:serine protease Do
VGTRFVQHEAIVALAVLALTLSGCRDQASATVRAGSPALGPVEMPPPLPSAAQAAPPSELATLIDHVRPVVVAISSARTSEPMGIDPEAQPHGGHPTPDRERAVGSGFVFSPDGLVLTNEHVIHGADTIEIKLSDSRRFDGIVIGVDSKLDVAIVRAKGAHDLPIASIGSSRPMRVGESVVAVGNPFGLGQSVSLGIVSAKERSLGTGPYDDFIQTDAAINPGNSGGPLFDMRGQVIGISTVMHARGRGIGFAIPIDDVMPVVPEMRETGHVTRGRLGVSFQALDEELAHFFHVAEPKGALIADLDPDGPAAHAGLRTGDVVTSIDGAPVVLAGELSRELGRRKPGERIRIGFLRNGAPKAAEAKLDRATDEPDELPAAGQKPPHASAHPLGLDLRDAPEGGARVESIDPSGVTADRLEQGDVIIEANGQPVKNAAELGAKIATIAKRPGPVLFRVRRGPLTAFVALRVP